MRLLAKLNLILVAVGAATLLPASFLVKGVIEDNAREQVLANARIMLETGMAMRGYTVEQVRPLLAPLMEDKFLRQSVPAYAATEIFEALRKKHPEYTYKEATLNPTNPRNRSVDWESDLVNVFRADPSREEIVGERDTPLGRSLYLSRPIRITDPACLPCHTTPDVAPPAMVAEYGSTGGYGWKLDETIGAQIVQVPMSTPITMAQEAFHSLLMVLGGVSVFTLIALNVLLHFVVIRPVRQLSEMADRVSHGDSSVGAVKLGGNDELATLAGSFERMRISLRKALSMLDDE